MSSTAGREFACTKNDYLGQDLLDVDLATKHWDYSFEGEVIRVSRSGYSQGLQMQISGSVFEEVLISKIPYYNDES